MNNYFITKLLSISILTSLPFGGDLFGQEIRFSAAKAEYKSPAASEIADNEVRLGYCTDRTGGNTVTSFDGGYFTDGGMILLPASLLEKYVGNSISRIDFAITSKSGELATVFVSKEFKGQAVSSVSLSDYEAGWNSVELTKPVEIVAGEDLYIGYNILMPPGESDVLLFDTSPYSMSGRNFIGTNGNWMSSDAVPYNLCIRAFATGNNIPTSDVGLGRFTANNYIEQNKPEEINIYVRNYGKETVNDVTFEVAMDDNEVIKNVTLNDLNIGHNEEVKINVPDVKIPAEGNFSFSVTATAVNGNPDTYMTDNTLSRIGYAMKEGSTPAAHNVLFEHFVSEKSSQSPISDEVYDAVIKDRDDVIMVKHHIGWQGDQFTLPEEEPYLELFSDGKRFVPGLALDRQRFGSFLEPGPVYFVSSESQVMSLINSCINLPCFIELAVDAKVDDANTMVTATVSGHAGTKEMPLQDDLRLTVWLVEDGVVSTEQIGYDTYIQNGVLRSILTASAWGDPLDISAYDFQKDYTITLDKSWNVDNLRVVAFASNYDSTTATDRAVYNTAQGICKNTSGINAVNGSQAEIIYNGGVLTASEGFKIAGVYDMSGRAVQSDNLRPGVYAVKITDGNKTSVRKLMIK